MKNALKLEPGGARARVGGAIMGAARINAAQTLCVAVVVGRPIMVEGAVVGGLARPHALATLPEPGIRR